MFLKFRRKVWKKCLLLFAIVWISSLILAPYHHNITNRFYQLETEFAIRRALLTNFCKKNFATTEDQTLSLQVPFLHFFVFFLFIHLNLFKFI